MGPMLSKLSCFRQDPQIARTWKEESESDSEFDSDSDSEVGDKVQNSMERELPPAFVKRNPATVTPAQARPPPLVAIPAPPPPSTPFLLTTNPESAYHLNQADDKLHLFFSKTPSSKGRPVVLVGPLGQKRLDIAVGPWSEFEIFSVADHLWGTYKSGKHAIRDDCIAIHEWISSTVRKRLEEDALLGTNLRFCELIQLAVLYGHYGEEIRFEEKKAIGVLTLLKFNPYSFAITLAVVGAHGAIYETYGLGAIPVYERTGKAKKAAEIFGAA